MTVVSRVVRPRDNQDKQNIQASIDRTSFVGNRTGLASAKGAYFKSRNIGLAEALTLLFIGLKLCEVIDWPWLWVLSPIWITLAFVLSVAVLIFILKKIAEK